MKSTLPPVQRPSRATGKAQDDLEARFAVLKSALVFSTWPTPVLKQLAEKSRMQSVAANVTVHAIGRVVTSIQVLASGTTQTGAVDSQGRRISLKLHSPGDVHGLFLWASQDQNHHHDMVTVEPSTFLVIPVEALEATLAAEPGLWRSIAVEASRRIGSALEAAMSLGLEPPRVRFARHILNQPRRIEARPDMSTLQVSMSQQVMAELLGVSRQTVTSLVRDFEQHGLIHWRYGRIAILDLDGLRHIAKFAWERQANP